MIHFKGLLSKIRVESCFFVYMESFSLVQMQQKHLLRVGFYLFQVRQE